MPGGSDANHSRVRSSIGRRACLRSAARAGSADSLAPASVATGAATWALPDSMQSDSPTTLSLMGAPGPFDLGSANGDNRVAPPASRRSSATTRWRLNSHPRLDSSSMPRVSSQRHDRATVLGESMLTA
jgi:hypothetical protein